MRTEEYTLVETRDTIEITDNPPVGADNVLVRVTVDAVAPLEARHINQCRNC